MSIQRSFFRSCFLLSLVLFLVSASATGNGDNPGQGQGQGAGQGAGPGAQGNNSVGAQGDGELRFSCNATANATANAACTANSTSDGRGRGEGPHSDDPRPRNWGVSNGRGETEFDDRKSPRKVAFLGQSANVRVYPNFSDPSVYLQLRFGKVQEQDAAGRPVPGHGISSLADASDATTFLSGNMTVNGVNMSYVTVVLTPTLRGSFKPTECRPPSNDTSGEDDDETAAPPSPSRRPPPPPPPSPSPAAAGRRLLSVRSLLSSGPGSGSPPPLPSGPAPQLNLTLLFGFDDALTFPYGDVNITVPRNGLKWTVSFRNWPFCNASNTLAVSLSLLLANNASATISSDADRNRTQQLTIRLGTAYNATLGFLDYALNGPNGTVRMPVGIAVTNGSSSSDSGSGSSNSSSAGSVTTITMALPNPAAANASGVWYDPTQTTTSAYLDVADPGNVAAASATLASAQPGAAAGLRTSLWAAAGALLLSAFMAGAGGAP